MKIKSSILVAFLNVYFTKAVSNSGRAMLILCFWAVTLSLHAQTVSTFAGTGSSGNANGNVANATFNGPREMVMDNAGNIFLVDSENDNIRKITPAGNVTTFAGTTTGDQDGMGSTAKFNDPFGIVIDAQGNLYVADAGNHKIRKITPAGNVSTFAGSGTPGDVNGTGTAASFNSPGNIAIDAAGNLYVSDNVNHKIKKITPAGVVTTFAGNGSYGSADGPALSANITYPGAIIIDASGNIFVKTLYAIRKITPGGTVTTFAGNVTVNGEVDGVGTAARFNDIADLEFDNTGTLFVTTFHSYKIKTIAPDGTVSTYSGSTYGDTNGPIASATYGFPHGIIFDGYKYFYVSDYEFKKIRRITIPVAPCNLVVTNVNDSGAGSLRECIKCANATAGKNTITFTLTASDTILVKTPLPAIIEAADIVGNKDASGWPTSNIKSAIPYSSFGFYEDSETNSGLRLEADNSTIKNVSVTGFFIGINFLLGNNVLIDNNAFINNSQAGIFVPGPFSNNNPYQVYSSMVIQKNTFNINKTDQIIGRSSYGIRITAENAVVDNNILGNCGVGIYATGKSTSYTNNYIGISKNNVKIADKSTSYDGIAICNNDQTFINNYCGNVQSGIAIYQCNAKGNLIKSNIIGEDAAGNAHSVNVGGWLYGSKANIFSENKISNFTTRAIERHYDTTAAIATVFISKNKIINNDASLKAIYDYNSPSPYINYKPVITSFSATGTSITVSGKSRPNDTTELFYCKKGYIESTDEYIGSAISNASGKWSITFTKNAQFDYVRATFTKNLCTSFLSAAFKVSTSVIPCIVTNTNDSGPGSLREAIICANQSPGPNAIHFDIPGNGIQTIMLQSALPSISDTIVIDGFTEGGANNYNIVLDGTNSSFANGLTLGDNSLDPALYSVNGSSIKGLVFKNFGTGISFAYANEKNITIQKCTFQNCSGGINVSSTASQITVLQNTFNTISNSIFSYYNISNSSFSYNTINNCHTVIDSYMADNLTLDHNTISNTTYKSFFLNAYKNGSVRYNNIYSSKSGITCQDCENAVIENNLIGKDSTGTKLGNEANAIELVQYGSTGTSCTIRNNIIVNSTGSGIYIHNNTTKILYVLGNSIGTDGSTIDMGNAGHGIDINPISGYVNIGDGTAVGENRIAYNDLHGINYNYGGSTQQANVNMNRNRIYKNTLKSINLGTTPGFQNNNNKVTPYITKMSYNGGVQTLTVVTDPTDLRVEIFSSDTTFKNTLQFIQPSASTKNNGVWTISFPAATPNGYYTVTATGTTNNTSEVGYALPKATVVINTNDSGFGSLRDAIIAANILSDTSYITFEIPGPPPHIIKPVNYYPFLKYSTVIDGGNKNDIVVDGSLKNHTNAGITIGDNGSSVPVFQKYSIVKNITVRGFQQGIHVTNSQKVLIENVICRNNTEAGFYLSSTSRNSIINKCESSGGTYGVFQWQGDTLIISNSYIHHNTQYGIGSGGSNTYKYIHVIGNTIAYNQDGVTASMSSAPMGVYNNFIYGNTNYGITNIRGQIKNIKGNVIGLDSTLTQKRPNKTGIFLDFTWDVFIDSNIVSGNTEYGITNSRNSMYLTRNYVGTNPNGDILGNGLTGVYGAYAGNVYLGGKTIDSANVIGNNGEYGVSMQYGFIKNNYIGVTKDFKDIGNKLSGAKIWLASFSVEGNYIGNNLESGIEGLISYSVFKNNKIGGDGVHDFGNKKWGIRDYRYATLVDNIVANNDSGAVKVVAAQGKISRNTFTDSPYAIYFDNVSANGNKQAAVFTNQAASATSLTLSGTGVDTDTIELFTSSLTPETALSYVGYAVVSGGVWQYTIPRGPGYPLKDNYYVNTATTTTNNTSRLSAPYKVPLVLYSNRLNVLPAQAGICVGSSYMLDAVVEDVTYSWTKAGSVISTSKQHSITEGGDYIIEVEDAFGNKASDTIHVIENTLPLAADFLMSSEAGILDKVVAVDISFSKPDSLVWDWDGATAVWDENKYLLTFPAEGTYTIKLTSYLGLCAKSAEHSITIKPGKMSPADGIVYPYTIKDVTGGPNPTDDILTVKAELANEDVITIHVHDIQGAMLYSYTTPDKAFTHLHDVSFSPFSRGHYLVKVLSGNDERLLRIIKQ